MSAKAAFWRFKAEPTIRVEPVFFFFKEEKKKRKDHIITFFFIITMLSYFGKINTLIP